jgi:queuine tRNA-ribosyltransferase accessory subunit
MTTFRVTSTSGDARCGVLTLDRSRGVEVETPAVLGYTRRGAPLHLTHDVLAYLPQQARLLGVQPLAFAGDAPTASTVATAGGLASFAGLPDCVLVASCREPYAYDAAVAPKNSSQGSDAGIAVSTQAGTKRVGPIAYAELLASLRCDIAIALADEPVAGDSVKRQRACAERTVRWLHDLRAALAVKAPDVLPSLWASIQGGGDVDERERAAQAAASLPVSGFSIGGFATGEAPDTRTKLLHAACAALPAHLPRHVAGLNSPEEILDAVSCGVDVVDGGYAHATTTQGCALLFPMDPQDTSGDTAVAPGIDGVKANLRALAFRLDGRPLCPGCSCFACARHTRAYVHHLLDTHEMLADILLDVHNTHHMLRFFAALRGSIGAGRFAEFRNFHLQRLQTAREAHAAAAADTQAQ